MKVLPLLCTVFCFCLAAYRAGAAEIAAVTFRPLSYDEAAQAASKEGKVILIDFYTTWCGPCKMLDRQTWADAAVGQLVNSKAVALRLDAEKEGAALAKRYEIDAYPTILLLKPDGTLIDRLVGFREPQPFSADFTAALEGRNALRRAQDEAERAQAKDLDAQIDARYKLARELAQQGKPAEALVEFLWLYDDGMAKSPAFAGVRLSYLLADIAKLAGKDPAATAALQQRRDSAKATLLADVANRKAVREFDALNRALGDTAASLVLFDQLPAGDKRRTGFMSIYEPLVKAKRYRDALQVKPFKQMIGRLGMEPPGLPEKVLVQLRRLTVKGAMTDLEVLVGTDSLADARTLIAKLRAIDPSDEAKTNLLATLTRMGHPELLDPPAPPATPPAKT